MRTVLYQIWATLYVEYVVKSPLSPIEHPDGIGVANELFEGGLERFIVSRAVAVSPSLSRAELSTQALRQPIPLSSTFPHFPSQFPFFCTFPDGLGPRGSAEANSRFLR